MPLKVLVTFQSELNGQCLVKHNVGKQKEMLCDLFCYFYLMNKLNKLKNCGSERSWCKRNFSKNILLCLTISSFLSSQTNFFIHPIVKEKNYCHLPQVMYLIAIVKTLVEILGWCNKIVACYFSLVNASCAVA